MCVVVLGDFGRSPRMQYHAISLANQANKNVYVVATGASLVFQYRTSRFQSDTRVRTPPTPQEVRNRMMRSSVIRTFTSGSFQISPPGFPASLDLLGSPLRLCTSTLRSCWCVMRMQITRMPSYCAEEM